MDRLRAHAAEGRLDIAELEDRLDRVLAAKTHADLDALLSDLPRRSSAEHAARVRGEFREHLRSYLWVNALLVLIWAFTDPGGPFWPVWPILGWGIGVASHASSLRSAQRVLPPPHASARA